MDECLMTRQNLTVSCLVDGINVFIFAVTTRFPILFGLDGIAEIVASEAEEPTFKTYP